MKKFCQYFFALALLIAFRSESAGAQELKVDICIYGDGDKKIPIETSWRYHYAIEPAIAQRQDYPNTPSVLFNGMVAPVLPFAIRGVIWYQGEGNSNMPEQYRSLFPAMITDWRKKWGQGEFPFFFVQLAGRSYTMPVDIRWALLREAQAMALKLPNTGMAVAVDIGEKNDIHPKNKKDVGYRLALAARHVVYGEDIVYSGPVFQSLSVSGSVATIGFAHIGSGLEVRGKPELNGFFVADRSEILSRHRNNRGHNRSDKFTECQNSGGRSIRVFELARSKPL